MQWLLLVVCRSPLSLSPKHVQIFIFTQVGVYSLSGPIVGKLVSRFGPRAVCISGAIIARSGRKNFWNCQ